MTMGLAVGAGKTGSDTNLLWESAPGMVSEGQLSVQMPDACFRPIPAIRTAGEFVIAPQSISWLNDINDCI